MDTLPEMIPAVESKNGKAYASFISSAWHCAVNFRAQSAVKGGHPTILGTTTAAYSLSA
jgi:hypothetical protein